jgi:hypothetical protein
MKLLKEGIDEAKALQLAVIKWAGQLGWWRTARLGGCRAWRDWPQACGCSISSSS